MDLKGVRLRCASQSATLIVAAGLLLLVLVMKHELSELRSEMREMRQTLLVHQRRPDFLVQRRLQDRPFGSAQKMLETQSIKAHGDGALIAPIQIASLTQDGTISMPKRTRYVLIEIGCSDRHTLDDELGRRQDGFLIAFEPLLDKYAVLLARGTTRYHGTKADRAVPLAHHHQRGVVLPLAVSASGGVHNFSVGSIAGCSSLRHVNAQAGWGHWCRRQLEWRLVPSITLTAALLLSGSLPVRQIKIDAQGVDFDLIRSTAPALLRERVQSIELETRASDCNPLYEGQAGCDDVVIFMRSIGFANTSRCPSKYWFNKWEYVQCERRLVFDRVADSY